MYNISLVPLKAMCYSFSLTTISTFQAGIKADVRFFTNRIHRDKLDILAVKRIKVFH